MSLSQAGMSRRFNLLKWLKKLWAWNKIHVPRLFFSILAFEANYLAATSLREVWNLFSSAAARYKKKHGIVPVLIIDNANKIPTTELEKIQDYAKNASDQGTATVVFVTSEGIVPRRMRGN